MAGWLDNFDVDDLVRVKIAEWELDGPHGGLKSVVFLLTFKDETILRYTDYPENNVTYETLEVAVKRLNSYLASRG